VISVPGVWKVQDWIWRIENKN